MPIHKVLFWSGFGIAVRLWQLGIEMRPLFHPQTAWIYGVYAAGFGGFGYWLTGVEQRQMSYLNKQRDRLLEKRRRRAEREGVDSAAFGPDALAGDIAIAAAEKRAR